MNGVNTSNIILSDGSYADPSWITSLAKSKVGLANVENTALSTWAGSTNITTLGTITGGTWNGTAVAGAFGGTGQTTTTTGDLLVGAAGNTWNKLAAVAAGSCLVSNGVGAAPTWGVCGLGSEADTLATVTARGATTATSSTFSGGLNATGAGTGLAVTNNATIGGTLNGATISGGTLSGGSLSGGTISGGTLTGYSCQRSQYRRHTHYLLARMQIHFG